jgi:N-acylneuraminate cytidylyltransferase
MNNEVVALILARGGSKGIPHKNLRTVGGKTLIQRSIESASSAFGADRVFVSSDSDAILKAARALGAGTIKRPHEFATDLSSSESALLHGLEFLDAFHGLNPRVLVFIQPTSPFILPESLEAGLGKMLTDEFDCVFSCTESRKFLWKIEDQIAVSVNHDHRERLRRQDIPSEFQETGAFYLMNTEMFRSSRHRFFGRRGIQLVPEWSAVDIDEESDLNLATAITTTLDYLESGLGDSALLGGKKVEQ